MNGKAMDERVTNLEKLAESLAPLPARMEAVEGQLGVVATRLSTVESQIMQLRTEMHVEFSAVRGEMADGFAAVRGEMADGFANARGELTHGLSGLRADIAACELVLSGHIHETQREMRVLHEAVISRIALIGEDRRPEA